MQFHLVLICIEVIYGVFRSIERFNLWHSELCRKSEVSTPAVNGDLVCCTRVSIETEVRPFTASFIWLSSCWMSLNLAPMTAPLSPIYKGWVHRLCCSYHASPHCDPLRGVCKGHTAWLGWFLLLHLLLEEG